MPRARASAASLAGCALSCLVALAACGGSGGSADGGGAASATVGAPAGRRPGVWRAGTDDPMPPTARRQLADDLAADLAAPRGPSDGGGTLRLLLDEGDDGSVARGRARSWTLEYTAGPHGVAVGGTLDFQPPPFWAWDPPQDVVPQMPGYTAVSTGAEGVELVVRALEAGVLRARVEGRALAEGETVRFVYGAGGQGARADRYAERRSPFQMFVDGDGDGVREALRDPPAVDVLPGPPALLVAAIDSSAPPGREVRLTIAVLDVAGDAGPEVEGELRLAADAGLELPERVPLPGEARGRVHVTCRPTSPGVYRVRVEGPGGLSAESNPLVVHADAPRILWADLHGHSNLSDGTGVPEDYYAYARDVAGLDVAALSDHDHWGLPFLDRTPAMWEEIRTATRAAHEPGRFVSLLAYEWTSWVHGHRHVLYFEDEGEVFSSVDPRYATPRGLWDALAGRAAMTLTHHSAGEPVPTDWSWRPDPVLEPLTEIVSVHGCSEAMDAPRVLRGAIPGNFARDALDQGYRLGFVGSGDSHDGHPGLVHLASPGGTGGVAAILSEDVTREAVLEALRARRAYATTGQRIVLRATLDGRPMGSDVPPGAGRLELEAVGTAPVREVVLVRSGAIVDAFPGDGGASVKHGWTLEGLASGEYVYVRIVQVDQSAAWCSPFFVE